MGMANEIELDGARHDAYAALRLPEFRLFMAGNFLGVFGMQMQAAAIDWELYERTGTSLNLGLVGLVQFLPVVALAPFTGHFADHFNRKRIVMTALLVIMLSSLGLAWISASQGDPLLIYGCLFVGGVARAFQQPARASLLPTIVPAEHFSNAVTWNTGAFHLATVLGPLVGGRIIDLTSQLTNGTAAVDYLIYAGALVGYIALLSQIQSRPAASVVIRSKASDFAAGFQFMWRNKIVLGAISLDLMAVLFGGSMAMLPAYAKTILDVGPTQLGCLQAAPAMGAFIMSMLLAHRPPFERAGRALLWGVAGFGVATILFGLSHWFLLSLFLLFLTGVFDNISVVIRHTLVQMLTPNALRGRVSAVNGLFIGASNELGRFESGIVAWLFENRFQSISGETFSVVSGGFGTLAVVTLTAIMWPQLRRYGRLGSEPVPYEKAHATE
jgi:MFS family permease